MALLTALVLALAGCGSSPDDPAPSFALQPVSQSVVAGASVTFSVALTGSGLSLQWQRSTDGGLTSPAIAVDNLIRKVAPDGTFVLVP